MIRVIRDGKYQNGLVLANGGVLSWQHAICLSAQPRSDNSPYIMQAVLDNGERSQGPEFTDQAQGQAVVEVCVLFPWLGLSNLSLDIHS